MTTGRMPGEGFAGSGLPFFRGWREQVRPRYRQQGDGGEVGAAARRRAGRPSPRTVPLWMSSQTGAGTAGEGDEAAEVHEGAAITVHGDNAAPVARAMPRARPGAWPIAEGM